MNFQIYEEWLDDDQCGICHKEYRNHENHSKNGDLRGRVFTHQIKEGNEPCHFSEICFQSLDVEKQLECPKCKQKVASSIIPFEAKQIISHSPLNITNVKAVTKDALTGGFLMMILTVFEHLKNYPIVNSVGIALLVIHTPKTEKFMKLYLSSSAGLIARFALSKFPQYQHFSSPASFAYAGLTGAIGAIIYSIISKTLRNRPIET